MDTQPIQVTLKATFVPDDGKGTARIQHMMGIDGNVQCVQSVLNGADDVWGGDPADQSTDLNVWRSDDDGSIRYWTGPVAALTDPAMDHLCESGTIAISIAPNLGILADLDFVAEPKR